MLTNVKHSPNYTHQNRDLTALLYSSSIIAFIHKNTAVQAFIDRLVALQQGLRYYSAP